MAVDAALPVRYCLDIFEARFANDIVASFHGVAPFMSFHVGDLIDPRGLIPDVFVPEGCHWKVTKVLHRVWEIEQSHITHQISICVSTVSRPE